MKDLGKKLFNKTWNFKNRNAIIEKLQSTNYDVLIIGGGITDAGIAREPKDICLSKYIIIKDISI